MRITPLDIQQKQFPVKFRGFEMDEVYAFLELVREEMEELMRENSSLKETVSRLDNQLKDYKNMETSLKDTLMTAQQMVDDYKANARKEAELVLRESEIKAEEMLRDAQERVVKIHEDIVDLKGIRRHFKEELKRLIQNHLQLIEFDREREGEDEAARGGSDFIRNEAENEADDL
ncbi:MAG: DivIVA domain-containing protein [Nitrospiraceae bacterium]|nr:DivIVA domain-containing protein [Nitrospiraceae bacterium]MDA8325265.1 DivIVA domain-containing protein [Nitrospiraceae bacterium]